MILKGNMSNKLCAEAMHTTVYLNNQLPTCDKPENKTPFELQTSQQPDWTYLILFGTLAFYYILKIRDTKRQYSREQCKGVGYEDINQYQVVARG